MMKTTGSTRASGGVAMSSGSSMNGAPVTVPNSVPRAVLRFFGVWSGRRAANSTSVPWTPWFIEVCRRVRLVRSEQGLSAVRAVSKAARIDAKVYRGHVGDPWAPVHIGDRKSLTLAGGDFDYRRLADLLFGGEWKVPLLATLGASETAKGSVLVAEALSRGNSKTEGFKSRMVPVPDRAVRLFRSDAAGKLSKFQLDEIKAFDEALRNALALLAGRGDWDNVRKGQYASSRSARERFDRAADTLFFPYLWRRLVAENSSERRRSANYGTRVPTCPVGRCQRGVGSVHVQHSLRNHSASEGRSAGSPGVPLAGMEAGLATSTNREAGGHRCRTLKMWAGPRLPRPECCKGLNRGPLAELRRMDGGTGAAGFWRLVAQHPETVGREQEPWMAIIHIVAILTPKGGAGVT